MTRRVEIISRSTVFRRFIFHIEEAVLRHERYDGQMSPVLTRLKFERGDSVAILMHDPSDDTVFLTEQFRFPAYNPAKGGGGWIVEIPAGSVDGGESPEATVRREVEEEIGYTLHEVRHISTFFLSPGGTSERILLYYARVNMSQQTGAGGGKWEEGEDIRVLRMPVAEAIARMTSGELADAKTIIGLQWMQLNGLAQAK
jgi:ADP-ribose pyrophosphatase